MKTYQEIMLEKYADELTEALSNDLNKACKILTKIFKGVTTGGAINLLDELEESGVDCSLLNDCFKSVNKLILKGTRAGSTDATMQISNIMETLHYDNGLPLSGYNYLRIIQQNGMIILAIMIETKIFGVSGGMKKSTTSPQTAKIFI